MKEETCKKCCWLTELSGEKGKFWCFSLMERKDQNSEECCDFQYKDEYNPY